jgi:hypothetical protein
MRLRSSNRRILSKFSIHSFSLTIPRSLSNPNTTLQVPVMTKCGHIPIMKYEAHAPGKNWRRRRKYCYEKDQGDLRVLHPFSECRQRRATEQVSVIRHRVCNHCSVDYVNNRLVGRWTGLESWRVYLFNKCASRHYVPLADWNKDTMAATNMRRIVQHWGEEFRLHGWNQRQSA